MGKRRCIGEDLGKSMTFLILASMLNKFKINLVHDFNIWEKPVHGFTLAPQEFKIQLELRHEN